MAGLLRDGQSGFSVKRGFILPILRFGVGVFLATHNPAGLIISTGTKVYGEASGKSTIEGRAKATADEIAKVLKPKFLAQGWISQ